MMSHEVGGSFHETSYDPRRSTNRVVIQTPTGPITRPDRGGWREGAYMRRREGESNEREQTIQTEPFIEGRARVQPRPGVVGQQVLGRRHAGRAQQRQDHGPVQHPGPGHAAPTLHEPQHRPDQKAEGHQQFTDLRQDGRRLRVRDDEPAEQADVPAVGVARLRGLQRVGQAGTKAGIEQLVPRGEQPLVAESRLRPPPRPTARRDRGPRRADPRTGPLAWLAAPLSCTQWDPWWGAGALLGLRSSVASSGV